MTRLNWFSKKPKSVCSSNPNIIKTKFQPGHAANRLTPDLYPSENQGYVSKMLEGIKDPSVKNIALFGDYCTGKSSILLQLKQELGGRVKNISFLTVRNLDDTQKDSIRQAEVNTDTKKEESRDGKILTKTISNQIQTEIFKQLYYGERPTTLRKTKYLRIGKGLSWPVSFGISLAICCLVSLTLLLLTPAEKLTEIRLLYCMLKRCPIIPVTACVGFLILIAYLVKLTSEILGRHPIGKLSAFNISADLSDNTPDFEQMTDELLYIFKETHYDVVIFEDLDRFDNPEIIEELRQLNYLLNESKDIDRKIVFIYPIKDKLIKAAGERVKLFDLAVPVVPFMASSNKGAHIISEFEVAGIDLSKEPRAVAVLSKYIKDMRELKYLREVYMTYMAVVGKNLSEAPSNASILGIAMLRVCYPEELLPSSSENTLSRILAGSTALWVKERDKKKQVLKLANNIRTGKYNISDALAEDYKSQYSNTPNHKPILKWSGAAYSAPYEDLDLDAMIQGIMNGDNSLAVSYPGSTMHYTIDSSYLKSHADSKIVEFINMKIQGAEYYEQELHDFDSINKFSLTEKVIKDTDGDFGKFVIDLVEAGMLMDNYLLYTSRMKHGNQSKEVMTFNEIYFKRREVLHDQNLSEKDAEEIIANLTVSDYDNPALYNFPVVDALCIEHKRELTTLVQKAQDNLSLFLDFLDAYCVLGQDRLEDTSGNNEAGPTSLLDTDIGDSSKLVSYFITETSKVYPEEVFSHIFNNTALEEDTERLYFLAALAGYGASETCIFDEDFSEVFQNYFEDAINEGLDLQICTLMADNDYFVSNVEKVNSQRAINCLFRAKNFTLSKKNIHKFTEDQLKELILGDKLIVQELTVLLGELLEGSQLALVLIDQIQNVTNDPEVYNAACARLQRYRRERSYERLLRLVKYADEPGVIKLAMSMSLSDKELLSILDTTPGDLANLKDYPGKQRKRLDNATYRSLAKRLKDIGIASSWKLNTTGYIVMRIAKKVEEAVAKISSN